MLKNKDLQDGRTSRGIYKKKCKIKFEFLYTGCQLSLINDAYIFTLRQLWNTEETMHHITFKKPYHIEPNNYFFFPTTQAFFSALVFLASKSF